MVQRPSHQPRVSSRSIGQAKGHPDELVLSKQRGERCLFSVRPSYRDSVEGSGSIKGGKDTAAGKAGQVVGDIRKREGILLGDGVKFPIVNGPANLLAVLLGNRDKRKRPRGVGLLDHSLFQPPVDLLS